jgi:hypothetical protein
MVKLLQQSIDGNMYRAIKALYSNTSVRVQVNDHFTPWFLTTSGVRQGDNLSPTLFALFLNDLAVELKALNLGVTAGEVNVPILLYADDIVLMSENEEKLQKQLDHVATWCRKWQLVINNNKSQVVHFRKKGTDMSNRIFHVNGTTLEIVQSYKYLGVLLDEYLTFENTMESLGTGGGRALGAIIAKFKALKNMGFNTYSKLFNNCVLPILTYGSGVWGLKCSTALQRVQNRAMRFFLGTHKFTPTLALLGDMGWFPITFYNNVEMIRLWNRLITMPEHRLTKKIFNWNMENRGEWSAEVARLLQNIDMDNTFHDKETCDIKIFSDKTKENIRKDWSEKVENKPKLRLYKTFKSELKTEMYVSSNISRSERSFLAQLRFGILPIHIETGRFTRKPIEERTCKICNSDIIEDEEHFLLSCNKYQVVRNTLFEKSCNKNPNFNTLNNADKIRFLMTTMANQTAKYTKEAYNIRYQEIHE